MGAPAFPLAPAEMQPQMQKTTAPAKPRSKPAEPKRARPAVVDSAALELVVTREYAYTPLALALARRSSHPEMADRAASAVVREATRLRLSPSLLAAVLLIENSPLDSVAVSHQGAIGMMQIMPVHLGSFGCVADLMSVDANICHGAGLLKHLVRRTGSVQAALKRYNGCVRGRNTPRCYRYPVRVLRTASRLRREMLASAANQGQIHHEALAVQSRPASIPSQPVTGTDTTLAPTGSATAQCTTLVGCLRYRWSLSN
jgi:soluble lytic murein transglycosylase-like protein